MKNGLIIDSNGIKYWYLNGKLHREDGPAIKYVNDNEFWYLNDKLHREDGPAVEYVDGTKYWYLNGKLHRTDGPAIEYADGDKYWYLSDKQLSKKEFESLRPIDFVLVKLYEKKA